MAAQFFHAEVHRVGDELQVPLALRGLGASPSDIAKQTLSRTLINLYPFYHWEADRNGSPLIR